MAGLPRTFPTIEEPRMISTCLRFALVASFAAASLPALEVSGDPPKYLTEKFRAEWRMKPLKDVLDDLGRFLEKPLVRSGNVAALLEKRLVVLVDDKKLALRETLELLESSQDLHFTAEPLRLRVETWEDFRDRKRRPVNLNLRDYALFGALRDFPAPAFGYVAGRNSGGGGFNLYSGGADGKKVNGGSPDPGAVIDWLQKISSSGGLELRGHGNVYVLVTDEEEAAMRKALEELHVRTTQRTGWRVSFGTLAATEAFTTGIIPTADATKLVARLQNRDAVTVAAISGQRVNAATRRSQAQLDDLDVVNYQYDPKIDVLNTGHSADLRPTIGMNFTWLNFHLAWVDPLEVATSDALNPARVASGGSTTTTSTTTTTQKEKEKETDTNKSVTVTQDAGTARIGALMQITKPTLWSWQPRGECYLAKGNALVLTAEHPGGRALIIVQETP